MGPLHPCRARKVSAFRPSRPGASCALISYNGFAARIRTCIWKPLHKPLFHKELFIRLRRLPVRHRSSPVHTVPGRSATPLRKSKPLLSRIRSAHRALTQFNGFARVIRTFVRPDQPSRRTVGSGNAARTVPRCMGSCPQQERLGVGLQRLEFASYLPTTSSPPVHP